MIKKSLHKINSLFYPFDKIFEIVIIGEDKKICEQFVEMCENFITNDELLQYGLEHTYNHTNKVYEIKIDKQSFVKFRFFDRAVPENEWQNANIEGDILVPIFDLDKYETFAYTLMPSHIIGFLGKVQQHKKTAITALINFDTVCNMPIANVAKWENTVNEVYDNLHCKKENWNSINTYGQEILKFIFDKFKEHINENTAYTAYKICNFFCYNETRGFSFGKEEFFSNLLIRLLSFDKLNNYKYQIK